MTELDREAELGARAERRDQLRNQRELRQMASGMATRSSTGGKTSGRVKTQTGSSKARSDKLNELKTKRAAKKTRSSAKAAGEDDDDDYAEGSAAKRKAKARKGSDDEDDEDGDASARSGSDSDEGVGRKGGKQEDDPVGVAELSAIVLPRFKLLQFHTKPWFGEYVKGAYIKVHLDDDDKPKDGSDRPSRSAYKLLEIVGLADDAEEAYELVSGSGMVKTKMQLDCKQPGEKRKPAAVSMARASDTPLDTVRWHA